ncbi:MAG: DUF1634 domain-containing protein [Clostridium sp.]
MENSKNAEEMIIKVLRIGVSISVLFIFTGMTMLFITGDSYYDMNNISFGIVIKEAMNFKPTYIIMLGLIILIITPVIRVLASIIVFKIEKDKIYVKITCVVLLILIISFFLGISF